MIIIQQPKIIQLNGKSRLVADIDIDGECKTLWFETDEEYEKYLCYERSDAFLVGALPFAMRNNHDIKCIAPVTEELLYNLEQHLIPTLCQTDSSVYRTSIITEYTSELLGNHGGVGTAMSGGVDSFYTTITHLKDLNTHTHPVLTHFFISNVGNFHNKSRKKYGVQRSKKETYELAEKIAEDIGLPLIETDSNFKDIFLGGKQIVYAIAFAVMAMRKLWKVYLLPASYDYGKFSLNQHTQKGSEYYALLLLNCFSTQELRFYCDGGPLDRIERTAAIVDFPTVKKYLYVCWVKGKNCGHCGKCRRTIMALDILEKLDDYKELFPIEYYKRHLKDYFAWLERRIPEDDKFALDIYKHMRKNGKYPEIVKKLEVLIEKMSPLYELQQERIKLKTTESKLNELRIKLKLTIKRMDSQKVKINSLYNSRSWRITKPLRILK